MKIITKTKISKWFIFFTILWTICFIVLGIGSSEESKPSEDSSPVLDTIYIIASPFVMAILYYFLYSLFNKWLVFISAPIIGIAMEWLLFRPSDVLNESNNLEATLFFAFVWSVILIPPYFMTKFSQKGRKYLLIMIALVILFLVGLIINLIIF